MKAIFSFLCFSREKNFGQATVEYIVILGMMSLIAVKVVHKFNRFLGETSGSLARVLSKNLTTGVCRDNCVWKGYINGISD